MPISRTNTKDHRLGVVSAEKGFPHKKTTVIPFDSSRDPVWECLRRIFASKQFSGSESLKKLLKYLVTKVLHSELDQIKEYSLGVEVFHRKESFDPRIDTIVRVQVRRLRLKLKEYYSSEGRYETMRIDIPKGCYIPAIYYYSGIDLSCKAGSHRCRVAVLPFRDLIVDIASDQFIDSLTEGLIAELASSNMLDVIASTSVFMFKKRHEDIRHIGKYLNVDAILEGSVQRSKEVLRMNTRLVNATTGLAIWGTALDLDVNLDKMAKQREVMDAIVPHVVALLGDWEKTLNLPEP